jgi:peptide deformylase
MAKKVKYYKGDLVEYDILPLVDFYDPILRKPTTPLKIETHEEREYAHYLAFTLAETLSELDGLGLSANQVGLPHRVCAINMGDQIWTMFNPVIIDSSLVPTKFQEGCLSYPGLYLKLDRPDHIKVRFQATNGEFLEQEFDGLTAVCVQHELDHLDGVLFTEKVSPIKLDQAKRKVKKNLKKMGLYKNALLDRQDSVVEDPPKSNIIQNESGPKITILDTNSSVAKSTEKFVYGTS